MEPRLNILTEEALTPFASVLFEIFCL